MNAIKPLIAIAAAAALSLPIAAAAASAASATTGNPEHSYNEYADTTPALANVAELRQGLVAFQRAGVSADGWYRYAGPEAGYRLATPAHGMQDETTNNHLALGQSKAPLLSGSIGARRWSGEGVTGG